MTAGCIVYLLIKIESIDFKVIAKFKFALLGIPKKDNLYLNAKTKSKLLLFLMQDKNFQVCFRYLVDTFFERVYIKVGVEYKNGSILIFPMLSLMFALYYLVWYNNHLVAFFASSCVKNTYINS